MSSQDLANLICLLYECTLGGDTMVSRRFTKECTRIRGGTHEKSVTADARAAMQRECKNHTGLMSCYCNCAALDSTLG